MVSIVNGDATALTVDEIYDLLEDALLAEGDYDTSSGSVFDSILTAVAHVLHDEQELNLVDVYDAAYLESATGESLANLVSVVGLDRRDPIHATGDVNFSHDGVVDQTYTVPSGTTVETSTGVGFDTTAEVTLPLWDDFESWTGGNYTGDTGSFQQNTNTVQEGSASLQSPDSTTGTITLDGSETRIGQTATWYQYMSSGGAGPDRGGLTIGGSGNYFELDASNDEVTVGGQTESHTIPHDEWVYVEATPKTNGEHELYVENASGTAIIDTTITQPGDGPYSSSGTNELQITAGNGEVFFDYAAAKATAAPVRAVEGGVDGNVGKNQVTSLPSPISGINDVYNALPIGSESDFTVTAETQTPGAPEESDDELRERARRVTGDGGAATIDAVLGGVLEVPSVTSVNLFENDTDTDNTPSGLPPVSFEIVVSGGTDKDIAEAIFSEKAATARDYGGTHGTATSETATAVNDQEFTITFSRPTEVNVDASLDLVVNDDYAGNTAVARAVVEYIGGTAPDEESITGLSAGEDVIINELEARIHDVAGIIGVDSSGSSYTPSTTTDSNGLEVISIGDNEVALTDGTDGSISISTTTV